MEGYRGVTWRIIGGYTESSRGVTWIVTGGGYMEGNSGLH